MSYSKTGLLGTAVAALMFGPPAGAEPIHQKPKAQPGGEPILAQPLIALTNANVLDVTSGEISEGQTVLIDSGKIKSISVDQPPEGAEIHDMNGYYIIPGFFDAHYHGSTLDAARYALESGVTTVRSANAYGTLDTNFRDAVAQGYLPGPEMLGTGVYVYRHLGMEALEDPELFEFLNVEVEGEDNLRKVVRVNVENGADWIKTRVGGNTAGGTADPFWLYYSEKEIAAIVDEAAKGGVKVMCHIQGEEAIIVATRAGCATIEHGQYVTEKALQFMKDNDAVWVPTYVSTEGFLLPHDDYNTPTARRVGPWILKNQQTMMRKAHELGVKMITGIDTAYNPDSVSRMAGEINSFIDYAGMTPLEAIQAATIRPAEIFGMDDRTGSVEVGKEADLVVFERNPLEEPMNLHNTMMVVSNGRIAVPFRSPYPGLDGRPDRSY